MTTGTHVIERFTIGKALAVLASALVGMAALPSAADAQPAAKLVRIGYLTPTPNAEREAVFRQALAKLGYVEGRNFVIEYSSADGNFARLPDLASELVRLKVDIIVAVVTQASIAAKGATATIPIVMVGTADPVGSGLVASLARPGGNVTGTSTASVDVVGKHLELLREVRPGVSRVAALWNPSNELFAALQLKEAKAAAAKLGIELQVFEARRPEALESAFAAMTGVRPGALLILADPMFGDNAERIARLATERRLPAVGGFANYANHGILLSYGSNLNEMHRGAAEYVDRILKGAKPADLPVERPTRFELVVNARTAKTLGISIPPSLAARADRVIQ